MKVCGPLEGSTHDWVAAPGHLCEVSCASAVKAANGARQLAVVSAAAGG
jgi:hypothetical protein